MSVEAMQWAAANAAGIGEERIAIIYALAWRARGAVVEEPHEKIGREAGGLERTMVRRRILSLEADGWLRRTHRGGRGVRYELALDHGAAQCSDGLSIGDLPISDGRLKGCPSDGHPMECPCRDEDVKRQGSPYPFMGGGGQQLATFPVPPAPAGQHGRRAGARRPAPSLAPRGRPCPLAGIDAHQAQELEQRWAAVLAHMRLAVSEATFATYLTPLHLHAAGAACHAPLLVGCPPDALTWVSQRFDRLLAAAAARAAGAQQVPVRLEACAGVAAAALVGASS